MSSCIEEWKGKGNGKENGREMEKQARIPPLISKNPKPKPTTKSNK